MSETKKKPLTIDEVTEPNTTEASPAVKAWQDAQVRKAIEEADAGDFATDKQLKGTIRKYVPDA